MKIYVAAEQSRAEEVLKKKQRQDETQFTTKIDEKKNTSLELSLPPKLVEKKTSLGLSYFVL